MGYELSVDPSTIDYFTSYLSLPSQSTPFNEIKKISDGSLISIKFDNNFSQFNIDFKDSYIPKGFEQKSKLSKNSVLDFVLEESYQADVNQALLLSGGIDSSNLAFSAGNISKELKAFCINTNLENQGYSKDLDYAKIVAKKNPYHSIL